MTDPTPLRLLDTVRGDSVISMQAALKAHRPRLGDVSRYAVEAWRDGSGQVDVVLFKGKPGAPVATLGIDARSGSEIDAKELRARMTQPADAGREAIDGRSLAAIESALPDFQRRGLDVSRFRIEVVQEGEQILVLFEHRDRAPGTRGHVPSAPAYEVELDRHDLRFVRGNFVR